MSNPLTKEEILETEHKNRVLNWDKVFRQNPTVIESAYAAMGIYAKQEASNFAMWILENDIDVCRDREYVWYDYLGKDFTAQELYDVYTAQSKKIK